MGIINLVCQNCGGELKLDDSREVGLCKYCGAKVIIKDEIIKNTHVHNITKYVYNEGGGKGADEHILDGERLLEVEQPTKAAAAFHKAIDAEPTNWLAWLKLSTLDPLTRNFQTAYKFAPAENTDEVLDKWTSFICDAAAFGSAYKTVKEPHKETLLKRWLDFMKNNPNKTDYINTYETVGAAEKEIVLDFAIKDMTKLHPAAHSNVIDFLCTNANAEQRQKLFDCIMEHYDFRAFAIPKAEDLQLVALAGRWFPTHWRTKLMAAMTRDLDRDLQGTSTTGKNYMEAYKLALKQEGEEVANDIVRHLLIHKELLMNFPFYQPLLADINKANKGALKRAEVSLKKDKKQQQKSRKP